MPLADWLLWLGESWLYLGNLAEAARCLQENIILSQEMGNPHSQADALVTLGHVVMLQGDMETARGHVRAGFALYQQIHEQQQAARFEGGRLLKPELVDSIWRTGLVALAEAQYEQAALRLVSLLGYNKGDKTDAGYNDDRHLLLRRMAQTAAQAVEVNTARSSNGRLLLHRHDQKNRSRRTPTLR
jgi:tetratricopeptide (TPR) repeat protein